MTFFAGDYYFIAAQSKVFGDLGCTVISTTCGVCKLNDELPKHAKCCI